MSRPAPWGAEQFQSSFPLPTQSRLPSRVLIGDEQLLSGFCGDRPFPQDHGVSVDIVVDGGELLLHMELHALDDLVHHGLPVEHGEVLDDLHVVDILLKQLPGHIGQGFGDAGLLEVFQLLEFFLDLLLPAICVWRRGRSVHRSPDSPSHGSPPGRDRPAAP